MIMNKKAKKVDSWPKYLAVQTFRWGWIPTIIYLGRFFIFYYVNYTYVLNSFVICKVHFFNTVLVINQKIH